MQKAESMENSGMVWRIVDDSQLSLRYWDDECVLYHGASGDTHRLSGLVGLLLEQLMRGPASSLALSDAINLHHEDVETALFELTRLGMVENK